MGNAARAAFTSVRNTLAGYPDGKVICWQKNSPKKFEQAVI